jgi:hypothetical protein
MKNAAGFVAAFFIGKSCVMRSGFGDEAGLDGLDADPLAFHLPRGQFDADALHVGLERALGLLDELESDSAAFFGLAFVYDATAFDWAFSGD